MHGKLDKFLLRPWLHFVTYPNFNISMQTYTHIYIKKTKFIACDRCEHQKIPYFFIHIYIYIYIYIYNCSLQRGQSPPQFINNPPSSIIGYPPIFWILFLSPPPPFPPASWHLSLSLIISKYITSICIKPCYDQA